MHRSFFAVTAALALLIASPAPTADAQETEPGDSGAAEIVDVGTKRPITSGDSTTAFTLRLPEQAACPGDSRNDGYRFHSFMVPVGTDVGELVYDNVRPLGDELNLPIREVTNSPFVHQLLAPNPEPGLPGLVPSGFQLVFGGWPAPGLTPGRYTVGIACTEPTEWAVVQYWDTDTEVVLETDPNGQNGEVVWEVAGSDAIAAGSPASNSGGADTVLILVAAASAVGLGTLVVLRQRTRNQRQLQKERS